MISTQQYPEMNQAVPNLNFATTQEMYEVPSPIQVPSPSHPLQWHVPSPQCQVPSPSQWLDPCRSPPTMHSPNHMSVDLDKLKDEPYSPAPQYTTLSSPPQLTPLTPTSMSSLTIPYKGEFMKENIKKEGFENSISFADIFAENESLVQGMNQTQVYYRGDIIHPSTPCTTPPMNQIQLESSINEDNKGLYLMETSSKIPFLDGLVDIKREVSKDQEKTSSPREILEAVGMLALDHARRDVQAVSQNLHIPMDPQDWNTENVKSWIKLQTSILSIPPLNLDLWNMGGQEFLKLTESQFKNIAPHGGELLFAKLEIWREALRTTAQVRHHSLQPNPQVIASLLGCHNHHHLQHHMQQSQIDQHHHLQQQQQQHHQMHHAQSQDSQHIQTNKIQPVHPQQQQQPQQQQPPNQQQQHCQQPSQTANMHHQNQMMNQGGQTSVVNQQAKPQSTTTTPSPRQVPSPQHHQNPQQYMEESCLDMSSLLSSGSNSPKGNLAMNPPLVIETKPEPMESDEEVEEETTPTPTGRGGTHIHLWQFLKELLQQPQLYGSCIRWLDRSKGVFKIEDSVRVAKLWGKRKNRPAMNYDKLSRSIRQYYKKGIMKKTERSQRLVYQFCNPYAL